MAWVSRCMHGWCSSSASPFMRVQKVAMVEDPEGMPWRKAHTYTSSAQSKTISSNGSNTAGPICYAIVAVSNRIAGESSTLKRKPERLFQQSSGVQA